MTKQPHVLTDDDVPEWGVLAGWAARKGTPGAIGEERLPYPYYDRLFVARDESGGPASILMVRIRYEDKEPHLIIAVTRPDQRRRGLASALFAAAIAAGVPAEELSGVNGLSADGLAFQVARRARLAPTKKRRWQR